MNYQQIKKLISELYSFDHSMISTLSIFSVIKAIQPYLLTIFTAVVIDLVLYEHTKQYIKYAVALFLITILILEILKGYYEAKFNRKREVFESRYDLKIINKNLSIDYQILEKHDTQIKLQEARDGLNYSGGISMMLVEIADIFQSAFMIVLTVVSLIVIIVKVNSVFITLSMFVIFTLLCVINILSLRKSSRLRFEFKKEIFKINQQFNYYTDITDDQVLGKDIRIYHFSNLVNEKYKAYFNESDEIKFSFYKVNSKLLKNNQLISELLIGSLYLIIFYLVIHSVLSIVYVTQIVGFIGQFNNALSRFILKMVEIQEKNKYIQDYMNYLNIPNLNHGNLSIKPNEVHEIEFRNVYFKYPNSKKYILNDLSFKFNFNQKISLVGLNGSGKTTIVKLLCQFYTPTNGSILLDGIPIQNYDKEQYDQLISAVFQDYQFLSASISENISGQTQENINTQKIDELLEKVNVKQKIDTLPQGKDSILFKEIEDGILLSGGQMQKLAIARALYKDAKLIILDEPTAALDPISEAEIFEDFHKLTNDKGAFFISHRLSSCTFCDKIFVLDQGQIIEAGSHQELLNKPQSLYASLWKMQFNQHVK